MNRQIEELDYLTLLGTFLGVLNYVQNTKQTSNDELLGEIKRQNDFFLQKVIRQNEEILSLLKEREK